MSEARGPETPAGSAPNSVAPSREADGRDQRNVSLTTVDTANIVNKLNALFGDVMSGRPYDKQQVKNATTLANTMVKIMRFEFDVYKRFVGGTKAPENIVEHDT